MLKILFIIGSGSFLGGVSRFVTSKWVHHSFASGFPYGTLVVNILGCLIIGTLYGLTERGQLMSHEWRLFLTVGFCGGFTTFSTFAEENFSLLSAGNIIQLAVNVSFSVFAGIMAVYLGAAAIRMI